MKNAIKTAALASVLMLTTSVALADAANAQQRGRQVSVSNSQGRSATSTTTHSAQNGQATRSRDVQTGSGRGYNSSSTTGYNEETGKRYRSGSVETNSGATAYRDTEAGCANGVCSRSSSTTGPGGNTVASETDRYIDDNGNYVKDKTYYGPNDNTTSKEVTRDGEGTKTTTTTGPQGESRSRTRWVTVD